MALAGTAKKSQEEESVNRSAVLACLLASCSLGVAAAGSREVISARRVRGAPMPSSLYFVALDDLARRFGARVGLEPETGAYYLERDGRRAVVLPGIAFALVGSQGVALREPTASRYGRVYLPRSLVPRLEELFRRGLSRRSPPRPTPRRVVAAKRRLIGRVCIDPGHGGKDPGAISRWGTREKDLVLAVGLMLASELRARGFEAVMTRSSDLFIELNDRPVLADKRRADLFISVHANSCRDPSVRGVEVYYADGRYDASAVAAEMVASGARPDPEDIGGAGDFDEATARALLEMLLEEYHRESRLLAEKLRASFARRGLTVRAVRGAGYRVLLRARRPAVLVEIGYLSNRTEERLLRTGSHRGRIVGAIADGVEEFRRAVER